MTKGVQDLFDISRRRQKRSKSLKNPLPATFRAGRARTDLAVVSVDVIEGGRFPIATTQRKMTGSDEFAFYGIDENNALDTARGSLCAGR